MYMFLRAGPTSPQLIYIYVIYIYIYSAYMYVYIYILYIHTYIYVQVQPPAAYICASENTRTAPLFFFLTFFHFLYLLPSSRSNLSLSMC
jgi:hypothetical protein